MPNGRKPIECRHGVSSQSVAPSRAFKGACTDAGRRGLQRQLDAQAQDMTNPQVEQNIFSALDIADRGYLTEICAGRLKGTVEELIHNKQVRTAYLGM